MLRQLIPLRYLSSPEVCEIADALQPELDAMQDAIDDVLAQLTLDTATWGLVLWERDYGARSNLSQTYQERRDHVRSKLRGVGTVNCAALESIAASYVSGETTVTEVPEEYLLRVAFRGVYGVPSNLQDLKNVLRTMRPAHLALAYIIRYRLWSEAAAYTWSRLGTHTWFDVKEGEM